MYECLSSIPFSNSDNKDKIKSYENVDQIKLGLKPNINQFLLLIVVNAFVGAMIGLDQTVTPILGQDIFNLESNVLILSLIASFGIVKAILNFFAGSLTDRFERKSVLVLGWVVGIPVPFFLLFAPNWDWILFANVLLGVNQGLARSMTVNMKIVLFGTKQRGLALGPMNLLVMYPSLEWVFLQGILLQLMNLKKIILFY